MPLSKCCSAPLTVEGSVTKFYKCQNCGKPTDPFDPEQVSLCYNCNCMTHHIVGSNGIVCGKCGFNKLLAYEQAARLATEEQEQIINSSVWRAKCHNCDRFLGLDHDTDNCLFHIVMRISQLEDRLKWHTIGLMLVALSIVINALGRIFNS